MKKIKLLYIFIICIFFVGKRTLTNAHPHVFIDTDITVGFNNAGLAYIKVAFVFDEMFSSDFIKNFDIDKNNILDEKEIKNVQENAFSNLVNYNYFIHVVVKGKKISFANVYDFNAKIQDQTVVYSFMLKPNIDIGDESQTIKIAPYDHSYYIDVALNKQNISFENTDGYIYSYKVIEDEQLAYYYEQIYPECIVLKVKKQQ